MKINMYVTSSEVDKRGSNASVSDIFECFTGATKKALQTIEAREYCDQQRKDILTTLGLDKPIDYKPSLRKATLHGQVVGLSDDKKGEEVIFKSDKGLVFSIPVQKLYKGVKLSQKKNKSLGSIIEEVFLKKSDVQKKEETNKPKVELIKKSDPRHSKYHENLGKKHTLAKAA